MAIALFEKNVVEANPVTETLKATAVSAVAGAASTGAIAWWFSLPPSVTNYHLARRVPLFAGLGGTFYGTYVTAASMRHKDDPWNGAIAGAVGGLLIGLTRRPSVPGLFFSTIAVSAACAGVDWARKNYEELNNLSHEDRMKRRSDGFFVYPPKDRIAARLKAIQEREASA